MDDFDWAKALEEYRKKHGLSHKQMGILLNISRQTYGRYKDGTVVPPPEKQKEIMKLLRSDPAPKWYQSSKWRWVTPIVFCALFFSLLVESVEFRAAYGGEEYIREHPPTKASFVWGGVVCVIYWYYLPPQWPVKLSTLRSSWQRVTKVIDYFKD